MCDHGFIGPCLEGCDSLPPCTVCGRDHDEANHDGDDDRETCNLTGNAEPCSQFCNMLDPQYDDFRPFCDESDRS